MPLKLFGILRIPPFVNHKGKDVNSDWLAGQWDERSVLGHARIDKRRMKGDDPEIDTAQTPKRFEGNLALQGKIRKTFADSIPNKKGKSVDKNFEITLAMGGTVKETFKTKS